MGCSTTIWDNSCSYWSIWKERLLFDNFVEMTYVYFVIQHEFHEVDLHS